MSSGRTLIPGYATPDGTARFRDRFAARYPRHFREAQGLWLSSIGLGTYLGDPTAAQDALYRQAIMRAIELGTNVLDSAVKDRKSTRLNSSHLVISYAVFCLKKKKKTHQR